MSTSPTAPCPICQRPAALERASNAAAPFCSPRCRTIDLGRWLSEGYRVAAVEQESDEELASHVPPRGEGQR